MNQEPWTDERLDRLASLVESNARLIQNLSQSSKENHQLIESNSRVIQNHSQLIESNSRVIQALAQASAEAREEREQLFRRMDQRDEEMQLMHMEIRGMQVENRRILDILLNQSQEDDQDNSHS